MRSNSGKDESRNYMRDPTTGRGDLMSSLAQRDLRGIPSPGQTIRSGISGHDHVRREARAAPTPRPHGGVRRHHIAEG